jgi:CRP/FNR family transcriptional regulator, cyclic AMP receptor protein
MSIVPRPSLYQELEYLGTASAYVEEVFDVLHEEVLFEDFSRQEIETLCQFMDCFAAPREAKLIVEGGEGDFLLIVLTGRVLVSKHPAAGQSVDIAAVGPGGTLGEMSMIDGARRFASCTAIEPVDFAVMTRANLNEILIRYPRLANKLLIKMLQITIGRLRDTGMVVINNSTPII